MHPRYVFIVNPFSGAGKGHTIAGMLNRMLPEHPDLGEGKGQVFSTSELDSACLHELLSKAEVVVAIGGDGTISYLIPHMLACESPPALGLIPLGTSNDLARALGVSVREDYTDQHVLHKSVNGLVLAERGFLDVLSINKKILFCNYFSIGLDAAIVRDFDNIRNSRWTRLLPATRATNNFLYLIMGLKNAGYHLEPPVEIAYGNENDDELYLKIDTRFRAIIISNLPVYAGGCHICPDARKDDGFFEVTIVRSAYQFIMLIATRFLPFLRLPRGLTQYRTRRARINPRPPFPFQIDGEKGPGAENTMTNLNVSIHASLPILIPR